MPSPLRGLLNVTGRVFLAAIFLMSAAGNKIPNFRAVAGMMEKQGVPSASVLLAGAIVFLIVGSLSVMIGLRARIGASLLLVFLILATYYFHNFWAYTGEARQNQMIQFLKNLGLMGAMLMILANGSGPMSIDGLLNRSSKSLEEAVR